MKKIMTIILLTLISVSMTTTFASSDINKSFTDYNNEYITDYKVDLIKHDVLNLKQIQEKVKSEENSENYKKYDNYFKNVLKKAQKTDTTFWKFYDQWIGFRSKIENVLLSWKVKSESKLAIFYTIHTNITEMIDELCKKAKSGCEMDRDDREKLKNLK